MIIAKWLLKLHILLLAFCAFHYDCANGYYFSSNDISGNHLRRSMLRNMVDQTQKKPGSSTGFDMIQPTKNWKTLAYDLNRSISANDEMDTDRKGLPDGLSVTNPAFRTALVNDQPESPSFGADIQPTEVQEYISEVKPYRDRRAAFPAFISRLTSLEKSHDSFYQPPKNWTPNYCIPDAMSNIRGTPNGSSAFSHMCHEGVGISDYERTIFPSWVRNARVLGICPWGIQELPLSEGSIPATLHELHCHCENRKCSSEGTAQCIAIKQHVSVWRRKSINPCEFVPDLVPVTVNCLCVQQPAPIAGSIGSPALFQ